MAQPPNFDPQRPQNPHPNYGQQPGYTQQVPYGQPNSYAQQPNTPQPGYPYHRNPPKEAACRGG